MGQSSKGYALSTQQKTFWLGRDAPAEQRDRCVLRLRGGPVDEESLREAVRAAVECHGILRTGFPQRPGIRLPIQSITERPDFGWRVCSACEPEADERAGAPSSGAEGAEQEEPPLRVSLDRRTAEESLLEIDLRSLCSDGHTLRRLADEILSGYASRAAGESAPDEGEPPVQYLEYVQWQTSLDEDEPSSEATELWNRADSGSGKGSLPYERQPEEGLPPRFDAVTFELDRELASSVEEAAGQLEVPVSALLAACWRVLLWRLSDRQAVLVGEVMDGRPYAELDSVLGPCAFTVPLPLDLQEGETVAAVARRLTRLREEAWEMLEDLLALRGTVQEPFWRAGFEMVDLREDPQAGDLDCSLVRAEVASEPLPLACRVVATPGHTRLEIAYDTRLFRERDVERVAACLRTAVDHAVREPECRLERLEILDRLLSRFCLEEANRREDAAAEAATLPELFEERVAEMPDETAIVSGDSGMTFGELDRRANQLAHHLRERGVGREDVAAVCVLDPFEMVVALLGISKAGAAYLPLDPTYPSARLALMCRDASVRLLLTETSVRDELELGEASQTELLCIDAEADAIERRPTAPPYGRPYPENLAYVLYTSGSTGRPKGVLVSHGALTNYLAWCREHYVSGQGTGAVVHTPIGFDLTVTSLWGALVSGVRLLFVPLDERVEGLARVLRREADLDLVKLTPSQLRLLSRFVPPSEAAGRVRSVVVGGEALMAEDVAFWIQNAPETRIVNEYGPTETTVGCSVHEVGSTEAGTGGGMPIGRSVRGARMYLLDSSLELVPPGIPGEILVGGRGVARGYSGRPGSTAERFVPDPCSGEPGARLYRTGDRGELLDDGELAFLGRTDRQVKIRDFRVELGEVEAVVGAHPDVGRCVVVVDRAQGESGRLVAYVETKQAQPKASELMSHARSILPEHMTPSIFVSVDSLPLTRRGKVDLEALPEPGRTRPSLAVDYVAPETSVERQIAEIWEDILQIEDVGVRDNFFDLGGHSYLMFEVHRRLREHFSRELSMVRLFQNPTINALARFILDGSAGDASFEESEQRADSRRSSMKRQREQRRKRRAAGELKL